METIKISRPLRVQTLLREETSKQNPLHLFLDCDFFFLIYILIME